MLELAGIVVWVLTGWAVLIAIHLGTGLWLRRLVAEPCRDLDAVFDATIAGWASTIAFLQLWNLVFPVSRGVFWMVALLGAAGLARHARALRDVLATLPRARSALVFVSFGAATLLLALWATTSSPDYDYGLYHTTAVRWTIEYPQVPGLGNVYARVAHNCASFRYVAWIEGSPFAGKGQHLATSVLLCVLLARSMLAALRLRADTVNAHELYWACVLPLLAALFPSAGSIAPDLSVGVVTIVLMAAVVRFALTEQADARDRDLLLAHVALVAGVGVSVKISFGPFGAVALALLVPLWWRARPARPARTLTVIAVVSVLAIAPWSLHSAIMTGYPIYPSPLFPLPVEWRVPLASVINVKNWIRSWGRQSHVSWVFVIESWAWLPGFVRGLWQAFVGVPSAYALIAFALLLVNGTVAGARLRRGLALSAIVLLPVLAYDLFWLVVAPTLRFNRCGFALPGVGAIVVGLYGVRARSFAPRVRAITLAAVAALTLFEALPRAGRLIASTPALVSTWRTEAEIKGEVPHVTYVSSHGVRIHHLDGDEHFTGVPLPVSPHYEFCARVAYREPGNLRAGFKVAPFAEGIITGFHGSAWPRPGFDLTPPPFWGYDASEGLSEAQPGTPQVRALTSTTRLFFDSRAGRRLLVLEGSTEQPITPAQLAAIQLNGAELAWRASERTSRGLRVALDARAGRNELTLVYATQPVVYAALQIIPPPSDGDEWWWGLYANANE